MNPQTSSPKKLNNIKDSDDSDDSDDTNSFRLTYYNCPKLQFVFNRPWQVKFERPKNTKSLNTIYQIYLPGGEAADGRQIFRTDSEMVALYPCETSSASGFHY